MDIGAPSRDGPTDAYLTHHDVTYRRGTASGRRHYSRAERLMDDGAILPQDFAACLRYAHDYARGVIGSSTIAAFRVGSPGGGGALSELRLDCTARHRAAALVLDGPKNALAVGASPSALMILFCHEDRSFREIGRLMGCSKQAAKSAVCRYAKMLADHYAECDRDRGRSITPMTKEGARRLLDPDDRPPMMEERRQR